MEKDISVGQEQWLNVLHLEEIKVVPLSCSGVSVSCCTVCIR